jgi:hypothetical protein
MNVIDVTDHFARIYGESIVKAERRGGDVLVLFTARGKYELEYRWLTGEHAELCRVLGSEVTRWGKDEVDPRQSLFEQFRLFL